MHYRKFGAIWGVVGVILILASAVGRVTPFVVDMLQLGLTSLQWIALTMWVLFMLVTEGYRGFQKQFSPRVVARAQYIARHGTMINIIFAPLFCFGYFGTTKRRQIVSVTLTLGLIGLVVLVHQVPQPWRGIIDAGVVTGLVYGIGWICIYSYRAIHASDYIVDPQAALSGQAAREL